MSNDENKPNGKIVSKLTSGNVSLTVWKNTITKDGKEIEIESVSVQKFYKDNKDQWKNTNSYQKNDVARLVAVCNAYLASNVKKVDPNQSA